MKRLYFNIYDRQFKTPRLLILGLLISLFVIIITWKPVPYLFPDDHFYIELAKGNIQSVPKPFSTRVLYPMLVQLFATGGGISTDQSFLVWGILSIVILCVSVCLIISKSNTPNTLLVAVVILLSPLLLSLFRDFYVPDLFYAALLGLYFLFLFEYAGSSKMFRGASLVVIFLLYMTRESTILLVFSIAIVGIYRKSERRYSYAVIIAALIGMLASSLAGRLGNPNIHAINDVLYMSLKIPYNFLKNILGVQLWTNTFASQVGGACRPVGTINLPAWLTLGSINSIGVCPFSPIHPLFTLTTLLTTFGVAPTILVYFLFMDFKKILLKSPLWLIVALIYGLISFFMGALVGASIERLVGYAWPGFWLATPVLLGYQYLSQKDLNKLPILYILACWLPWFVFSWFKVTLPSTLFVLATVFLIHIITYRTIHHSIDKGTIIVHSF
jgi:hypothetical protein